MKKSKLTLIKEENAELKELVARLERQLAGIEPATPSSASKEVPADTKNLPALSRLHIENEPDYKQDYDPEDEEPYDGPASAYDTGTGNYPVQPQQPAEPYPTASNHSTRQDSYSQPPHHTAQSGQYQAVPRQYPSGQPQPGYGSYQVPAGSYYTQPGPSPVDAYHAGLTPTERPRVSYDAQLPSETHYSTWSAVRNDPQAPGTSSYTPSPSGGQWQQLPCLSPEDTPASPGGPSYPTSSNYSQAVTFEDYGAYHGGAMPSYDVYQGAPIPRPATVPRRRPMPSPPVFGHDVIMTFFQKWRSDNQARAYITDDYVGTHPAHDSSNWALVGNWWERVSSSLGCETFKLTTAQDDLPVSARDQL